MMLADGSRQELCTHPLEYVWRGAGVLLVLATVGSSEPRTRPGLLKLLDNCVLANGASRRSYDVGSVTLPFCRCGH